MEVKTTERGFARIDFTDRYGQPCSLQESSLAMESAIWLGSDGPGPQMAAKGRMHLTQDMVRALLPHLQAFVETGGIADARK